MRRLEGMVIKDESVPANSDAPLWKSRMLSS